MHRSFLSIFFVNLWHLPHKKKQLCDTGGGRKCIEGGLCTIFPLRLFLYSKISGVHTPQNEYPPWAWISNEKAPWGLLFGRGFKRNVAIHFPPFLFRVCDNGFQIEWDEFNFLPTLSCPIKQFCVSPRALCVSVCCQGILFYFCCL